jgi:hypothetical protein
VRSIDRFEIALREKIFAVCLHGFSGGGFGAPLAASYAEEAND